MKNTYSIYKITNTMNDKLYIGQTAFGIEKRFKEHTNKAKSGNYNHRPLYSAMNKYGIENFNIELIENGLSKEEANEREQYWISFYSTYNDNGYNATIGGDDGGTHSCTVYQIDMNTLKVIKKFESTREAARNYAKNGNNAPINKVCLGKSNSAYGFYWCYENNYETFIKEKELTNKTKETKKVKKVEQYDLTTNEIINTYDSAWLAENELNVTHGHIKRVCNGERKSYKGYGWRYVA